MLEVAARRFAAVGPERVSLEEIADEADIARGTLYSHFPTKESLIDEVLRPVLERAAERGAAAADLAPGEAIDRLLRLYLELWRDFPYRLRLTYRMSERSLGGQAATHQRFLGAVLRIFESAAGQGKLRAGDAHLAARTLSAVAVPLLELFDGRPGGDALFIETMRSALLRGVERPDGAISC